MSREGRLTVDESESNDEGETHVCKERVGFLKSDPVSDLTMLEGMEYVRLRMEVVNEFVRKEGAAGKRLHTTCVRVKRRVEERE